MEAFRAAVESAFSSAFSLGGGQPHGPSSSTGDDEQEQILLRSLLRRGAAEGLETSALEDILKETALSEEQQEVVAEFWRLRRDEVLDAAHSETTWNNRLQKISWRIDTKTKTRHVDELNDLTAIVELVLGSDGVTPTRSSEVVRFELDAKQLKAFSSRVHDIQAQVEALSGL